MPSENRKKLRTIDLTRYQPVIQIFSERLSFRNLALKTQQSYVSNLKIFLSWCALFLDSKDVMLLDYDDFRMFLFFLDQEKLGPRSINVYIATLKQFKLWIQKESWNKYEISFRRYDRLLPHVLSVEHAGSIVAACETTLEKSIVMLLLSTGIRLSESCALTFGDICRDRKQIYIRPGKGRSDRYVPLNDSILEVLEQYWHERALICHDLGIPVPGKADRIFYFKDGVNPASNNFLRRVFKSVVKRAGLSVYRYTPHSCRHYFALQIYLQQKNLALVKELLGHRSLNATEVYLRLAAPDTFQNDGYINPLTLCMQGATI